MEKTAPSSFRLQDRPKLNSEKVEKWAGTQVTRPSSEYSRGLLTYLYQSYQKSVSAHNCQTHWPLVPDLHLQNSRLRKSMTALP